MSTFRHRPVPVGRIAGGIFLLLLGVAALACGLGPEFAPAIAPASATMTPAVTPTAIPAASPVPTRTRTPLPTPTATPMPSWVEDFAQPILVRVAGQEPAIQDTFEDNSGGWRCLPHWIRPSSMEIIDGELVLDPCALSRSNMAFADFVLELDIRFLKGAQSSDRFRIIFRNQASVDMGVPEAYKIFIGPFGDIEVFLPPFDRRKAELKVELSDPPPTSDHIVLIVNGPRIAFLLNGTPVTDFHDSTILRRGGIQFETYNSVAIDNLKIWDLTGIADP